MAETTSNDPGLLLMISLANGPKHGHAMLLDVEQVRGRPTWAGHSLRSICRGSRLAARSSPLPIDGRRRPYRLTDDGRAALERRFGRTATRRRDGHCPGRAVIRWLLRLYPAGWRSRYGDEVAQLVTDAGGLTVGTGINLIQGGLRERGREFRNDLIGGGGMTIGPAYRHPTGLALLGLVVLGPVLLVVVGSLLVYQLGIGALQQPMDSLNAWLSTAPRFVDLLLVLSPAIALCIAAAPLLRFDVTSDTSGREAHLGVRLRAANVVVGLLALGIGVVLVWHIVSESVLQAGA